MATTKRKLTVLQSEPGEGDPPRPPWQWVGFGAVMIVTAWLPLAYAGAALAGKDGGSLGTVLVATILPLVLAATSGGFLVGRFGKPAAAREALLAGFAVGLVAVLFTALSGPFSPIFLVVVVIATAFAGLGGALGVRQRGA